MRVSSVPTVRPRLVQVERRPHERPVSGPAWEAVRRLLVVRDDRLGDVVLTLPAVSALRRTYPEARLGLLVGPAVADLARLVDGVDDVLEYSPNGGRLRAEISRFSPDAAVCISRRASTAWALYREGVRRVAGPGRRLYSALFSRRLGESRSHSERHEVEYSLSFAHLVGATSGEARFPIRLSESARLAAGEWVADHSLGAGAALLHVGSGGSCPGWPVEHFVRLARELIRAGCAVACSTAVDRGERLRRRLEVADLPVPVFSGGLPTLAALTTRVALVVASSTGPLHLAAALGTRTLALHAPWLSCGPARWGPYAENGWALVADSPAAAGWSRTERRRHGDALLAGLTPDAVFRAARALLEGRAPQGLHSS